MSDQPRMAERISARQWTLAFVILALGAGHLGYRLSVAHRLEQTAALFIGLPMIIGMLLALTPRAKSVTGMICKTMTIALVMSGLVLGEGFICILMAAPLFYLVGEDGGEARLVATEAPRSGHLH